jgi:hypothetical protein
MAPRRSSGEVIPLRSHAAYKPDFDALACRQLRAARLSRDMPVGEFAKVLTDLVGWPVTPSAVEAWEDAAGAQPPASVVLAAQHLSRNPEALAGAAAPDQPEVFVDLTEEDNRVIAQRIRGASAIFFAAHTGYNAMVSQYQAPIRDAVANECTVRVVVSNPDGPLMASKELTRRLCPSIRQEGEIGDVLRACARHRRHAMQLGMPADNVQARVYNGVPSMNVMLVDGWLRVIPYLPLVDAADSPVFEYIFDADDPPPLIRKYLVAIERLWEDSEATCDEEAPQPRPATTQHAG